MTQDIFEWIWSAGTTRKKITVPALQPIFKYYRALYWNIKKYITISLSLTIGVLECVCVDIWLNEWCQVFHEQYKKTSCVVINIPAVFKWLRNEGNMPPCVIHIRMCCGFLFLRLFSHNSQQSAITAKGIETVSKTLIVLQDGSLISNYL